MRSLLVLALCLGAVCADFQNRLKRDDFHSRHYSAHQQAIDTARKNAYGSNGYVSGGSAGFGVGANANLAAGGGGCSSCGGSLDAGAGTAYLGALESSYDSVGAVDGAETSGSSVGGGAAFGATNAAGFGAQNSASFGSNSAFSTNSAFQASQSANFNAASSHNVASNVEFADANNAGTEVNFGGSRLLQTPVALPTPVTSGGNVEYLRREHIVSSAPQQVVYTVPGGAQKYVEHVERTVEQQPRVQYVQVAQPAGTSEQYYKHKITTTASAPQLYVQPTSSYTYGANTGSSFGTNSAFKVNQHVGFDNNFGHRSGAQSVLNAGQAGGIGFGSGSSQLHQLISQAQINARQQAASGASLSSGAGLAHANQVQLGGANAYNTNSNYGYSSGSSLNSATSMNAGSLLSGSLLSGSLLGGSSSNSQLNAQNNYGLGLSTGLSSGLSTGLSSGLSTGLSSGLTSGQQLASSGNFGANAGVGGAGSGYQTKQWEKQSKWSSQSEFDSDGHVKNYKDLATGESENYNVNGKQFGYNAATASVDDNGKVSTYSVHS